MTPQADRRDWLHLHASSSNLHRVSKPRYELPEKAAEMLEQAAAEPQASPAVWLELAETRFTLGHSRRHARGHAVPGDNIVDNFRAHSVRGIVFG